MDFKYIDKKYRPIPFWSWNDKINVDETLRQTKIMDEAGMGGYFMHARGGLEIEYMGNEWFENVAACIEDAKNRGMGAWVYDENGWPSGFCDGRVTDKGEKYWQKQLKVIPADADRSEIPSHRIISVTDKYCFYYEVNPFYVDLLDPDVVVDFIDEIYRPYYEKFGDSFEGYFTDEPALCRNGISWSAVYPEAYRSAYGEDLISVLSCLFYEEEGFEDVRVKFWKLTTELFSKNFVKQVYDWCEERNLKYTGHLLGEGPGAFQVVCNGAAMPHYEYFSIPAIDWLGRTIGDYMHPIQVASVAAQLGKKQVLCEAFGLCGHNMTHDLLKRNFEWMMVRGVNLLCQHLQGYTNRGLRKRDCPPALYTQQPWWPKYRIFNDAMSRIGMLLAEGKIKVNTLVLSNMTSVWICYNNGTNTYKEKNPAYYDGAVVKEIRELDRKHIPFHLGDEILIERHGRVNGKRFMIGEMAYDRIVIPEHIRFLPYTERLLAEFKANGGVIAAAVELEENPVVDSEKLSYTCREFNDFTMHYFVNLKNETVEARFNCGSYALDIASGDRVDFYGEHTFAPYESLVLIDDGTPHAVRNCEKQLEELDLTGKWSIAGKTANSMLLDKCTYWFDGELQEDNGFVLNVTQRANALEREVDVVCNFDFTVDDIPSKLYLGCETPEIFELTINGSAVDKTDCGCFRDQSIRLLDISDKVRVGVNTLAAKTKLKQSPEMYENIRNAYYFETARNKLYYAMEIEAFYLVGDFSVKCNGSREEVDVTDSYFYDGGFSIGKSEDAISLASIDRQGYPFFAGEMTFKKVFDLKHTNYKLRFNKKGVNVIEVKVNGKHVKDILWSPYFVDISDFLVVGENTVEITIYNNIRNLFGPHHSAQGELWSVGTQAFYREDCVWTAFNEGGHAKESTDRYSFVNTGII